MRELDIGFANHIGSGATTLATCWRITRADGVVLGFTDHDEALTFDGTDFEPAHGLDGGEKAAKLGAQVDASEISGVVHADAVDENDILLGRFDGASVETFRVNWRDPTQRHLMRLDTIGEISRIDGVFRMELRSAQHALNVAKGNFYQSFCGTNLGAAPCGIDLEQSAFKTTTTIISVESRHVVTTDLLVGFADNWFDFGRALWTSGARDAKTDRVTAQVTSGAATRLTFAEPIADWVEVGDGLTLYAGCDRHLSTCRSKFDNVNNFRGFPHIPGNDFVLRYPRAGSNLAGQALIK